MSTPQVWFVTGASTGFGRLTIEYVLSKGDIAVATLRKPEVLNDLKAKYPPSQLLILKLDVTKPRDITDAFEKTKQTFGRLDVVFNNAGYSIFGEIEGTPEEVARSLFEVTFWGADRVAKEAVKFFREVNAPGVGGRLLNNSSSAGISAIPGVGYYSASKYALEGLTQSLAAELDPEWNIKVTLIEAGAFRTNAISNAVIIPPHPAYTDSKYGANGVRKLLETAAATFGANAEKAVKKLYELAHLPDPPLRFLIGKDSIATGRKQVQQIVADVDKYESWSEELGFDNEA